MVTVISRLKARHQARIGADLEVMAEGRRLLLPAFPVLWVLLVAILGPVSGCSSWSLRPAKDGLPPGYLMRTRVSCHKSVITNSAPDGHCSGGMENPRPVTPETAQIKASASTVTGSSPTSTKISVPLCRTR